MSEPPTPTVAKLLRHQRWLRRVAASLAVDSAQADDLTQQALLAALERPPADAARPRAWLAAVVQNLARRFGANERRRTAREQVAAAASHELAPPTDAVVARAALQTEVATALLTLAEPYRTALLLRFFEELPPRAIAKRTGAPVETVRTRIKRGLEMLRGELVRRRGPAGATDSTWAVALIGLLDTGLRRAVRHALLAKAAGVGAGASAGAVGTSTWIAVAGVVGMTTKAKLVAAALVVAGGTFAVVKLCESPKLPANDSTARAWRGAPDLAAPATVDPNSPPASADVTRTAEAPTTAAPTPAAVVAATAPLAGEGVIEGTVHDPGAIPSEGARVFLRTTSESTFMDSLAGMCGNLHSIGLEEGLPKQPRQCVTAVDGRYRFEHVPSRVSHLLIAIHPEVGMALATDVVVAAAEARRVDLDLVGGVVFVGSLTDRQGAAIPGAELDLHESDGGHGLTGIPIGKDGRFRSLALPFHQFSLRAHAPGFIDQPIAAFDIPPGEREHTLEIRLERATTLRGRLFASNGSLGDLAALQPHLGVAASRADPRTQIGGIQAYDSRGTIRGGAGDYEITPKRGDERFVSVWGRGRLLGVAEVLAPGLGPDVVVDVARAPVRSLGRFTLVVTNASDATPVADFKAELAVDPLAADEAKHDEHPRDLRGVDGKASADDVEAGDYYLALHAGGFAPLFRRIRFAPADPPVAVAVELQPAAEALDGRVVDSDERPLAGVELRLCDLSGEAALSGQDYLRTTGGDGSFSFAPIGAGEYLIVATKEPYAVEVARVSVGGRKRAGEAAAKRPLLLTLSSGTQVTIAPRGRGVEVYGPLMYRIRNAQGALIVDDAQPWMLWTTSGGSKSVTLHPGDYSVELFCPGIAPARANFSVPHDGAVEVELAPTWDPAGAGSK